MSRLPVVLAGLFVGLVARMSQAAEPGVAPPVAATVLRSIATCLQDLVSKDAKFDAERAPDDLSSDMRDLFDGAQYFLSDSLRAQFLGLSDDALRREWWRRYWRLRDPTPTTPANERLVEHMRRVRYARENYFWKERPYWDDRGMFYILLGEPTTVTSDAANVKMGLGFIPRSETWRYSEVVSARFEQQIPLGPWRLGRSGAQQTNRRDLLDEASASDVYVPVRMQGLDGDRLDASELAPDAHRPALEAYATSPGEMLAARIVESGRDRLVMPGGPKPLLSYVFDASVFRDVSDRMRIEVHVQLDLHSLRFERQDSLYVARYRIEGVLLDGALGEAARDAYEDVARARQLATTTRATLWPGQLQFVVAPGSYRLALRVADLGSGAEATYLADVGVPVLPARRLALSDVEMASWIGSSADGGSRFSKHGRLVVPNPVAVYRHGNKLTGYFEIYGLQLDSDKRSRYRVSYSIVPRSRMRKQGWFPGQGPEERPSVTSSFSGQGTASESIQELRIDVTSLDENRYDLVLTVADLVGGTEATRRTVFYVKH